MSENNINKEEKEEILSNMNNDKKDEIKQINEINDNINQGNNIIINIESKEEQNNFSLKKENENVLNQSLSPKKPIKDIKMEILTKTKFEEKLPLSNNNVENNNKMNFDTKNIPNLIGEENNKNSAFNIINNFEIQSDNINDDNKLNLEFGSSSFANFNLNENKQNDLIKINSNLSLGNKSTTEKTKSENESNILNIQNNVYSKGSLNNEMRNEINKENLIISNIKNNEVQPEIKINNGNNKNDKEKNDKPEDITEKDNDGIKSLFKERKKKKLGVNKNIFEGKTLSIGQTPLNKLTENQIVNKEKEKINIFQNITNKTQSNDKTNKEEIIQKKDLNKDIINKTQNNEVFSSLGNNYIENIFEIKNKNSDINNNNENNLHIKLDIPEVNIDIKVDEVDFDEKKNNKDKNIIFECDKNINEINTNSNKIKNELQNNNDISNSQNLFLSNKFENNNSNIIDNTNEPHILIQEKIPSIGKVPLKALTINSRAKIEGKEEYNFFKNIKNKVTKSSSNDNNNSSQNIQENKLFKHEDNNLEGKNNSLFFNSNINPNLDENKIPCLFGNKSIKDTKENKNEETLINDNINNNFGNFKEELKIENIPLLNNNSNNNLKKAKQINNSSDLFHNIEMHKDLSLFKDCSFVKNKDDTNNLFFSQSKDKDDEQKNSLFYNSLFNESENSNNNNNFLFGISNNQLNNHSYSYNKNNNPFISETKQKNNNSDFVFFSSSIQSETNNNNNKIKNNKGELSDLKNKDIQIMDKNKNSNNNSKIIVKRDKNINVNKNNSKSTKGTKKKNDVKGNLQKVCKVNRKDEKLSITNLFILALPLIFIVAYIYNITKP